MVKLGVNLDELLHGRVCGKVDNNCCFAFEDQLRLYPQHNPHSNEVRTQQVIINVCFVLFQGSYKTHEENFGNLWLARGTCGKVETTWRTMGRSQATPHIFILFSLVLKLE